MKALLFVLLLPMCAQANPHENIPIDKAYILVCREGTEVFFIRPTGIVYGMNGVNGVNGAPNCLGAVDTTGVDHVLCKVEDSPVTCELAHPGVKYDRGSLRVRDGGDSAAVRGRWRDTDPRPRRLEMPFEMRAVFEAVEVTTPAIEF